MEYKVRKFQTPSGTLQYFANLNAEARGKNSSPEERVRRAFDLKKDQEEHNTPELRTDRNGVVSVDYENQGDYVPTTTHKIGTALQDTGTRLLHGVQTLGSSIVGDAIKGFSPSAANWLERNTFGVISQTPQEKLNRNRQGNWNRRIADTANSVSTVVGFGSLGGVGRAAMGTRAGQGLLGSKLGQTVTRQGTKFVPKDTRFLVNRKGYTAPKISDKPIKKIHTLDDDLFNGTLEDQLKREQISNNPFRNFMEQYVNKPARHIKKEYIDKPVQNVKDNLALNERIELSKENLALKKEARLDKLNPNTLARNRRISASGDEYFKILGSPEAQSKLKTFGETYGVDLLGSYNRALQSWNKGKTSYGTNKNFRLSSTYFDKNAENASIMGMSTSKNYIKRHYLNKSLGNLKRDFSGNIIDTVYEKELKDKISDLSINYIRKGSTAADYDRIVWHELSHYLNKESFSNNPKLKREISNLFKLDKTEMNPQELLRTANTRWSAEGGLRDKVFKSVADIPEYTINKNHNYITEPTETWAFLSTNLRQDAKKLGGLKNYTDDITPEILERLNKTPNNAYARWKPFIKDNDKFLKFVNQMTLTGAPIIGGAVGMNKE